MTTPTAPGTTVGEQATAGEYTWQWNGYGWDLVQTSGAWYARVRVGWTIIPNSHDPTGIDYA